MDNMQVDLKRLLEAMTEKKNREQEQGLLKLKAAVDEMYTLYEYLTEGGFTETQAFQIFLIILNKVL